MRLPKWTPAPESRSYGGESSRASDVWMLGLALWELLNADNFNRPFAHLNKPEEIRKCMRKDGSPVPLKWTGTESRLFRALVEDCCSLKQNERPTIDEVVNRLALLQRQASGNVLYGFNFFALSKCER